MVESRATTAEVKRLTPVERDRRIAYVLFVAVALWGILGLISSVGD